LNNKLVRYLLIPIKQQTYMQASILYNVRSVQTVQ